MGRSVLNLIRAAVIACACAMLFAGVRGAWAQTSNDDRYGFEPIPAPTMPVQQGALGPAQQNFQPPAQNNAPGLAAQNNGAPVMSGPPSQQTIAPPMPVQMQAPQTQAPQQSYPQSYPQPNAPPMQQAPYPPTYAQQQAPQAPYPQAPAQQPPPQQGYNVAPPQPYGYVPLQPNNGGYYAPGDSRYGTQVAAAPNSYYAASDNGQGLASGYLLGPGDKVHVSVYGEDDLTGDYQIDGSGMVRLPLIGTLHAAGFTAPALENAIGGALARGYLKNPRVNVEISAYRPFYVIGAVNRPGNYPYVANMSALDAVALGGGFTDQARQSTVYVRHEGSVDEVELPASQMTRIWPGDVVRVKDTLFWDAMSIFTPLAGPAALAAAAIH
jgi:polysaccharide export outer membrane protein